MKTMTVRFDDELWAALRATAFIENRRMSEIIRTALITHLHARCNEPAFRALPLAATVIAAIR